MGRRSIIYIGLAPDNVEDPAHPGVYLNNSYVEKKVIATEIEVSIMNTSSSDSTNETITYGNPLSFNINNYILKHKHDIRYVRYQDGNRWSIKKMIQNSRTMTVYLGGAYNG